MKKITLQKICFGFALLVCTPFVARAESVTLTVNPNPVYRNSTTSISWSASSLGASCTTYGFGSGSGYGGNGSVNYLANTASNSVNISILCQFPDLETVSDSKTITIEEAPDNATILNSSQSTVTAGSQITLTWSTVNASYCTTNSWPSGGNLATSGSINRSVYTTTTYSITCYYNDGSSDTVSRTVTVSAPQNSTTLNTSQSTITSGSQITLTWSSVNASYCTTSSWPSGGTLATSGSINRSPVSTTTYSLTCYYVDGSNETVSRTVTVSAPQNSVSLTANPISISAGGSTTLSWSSVNASYCTTISWPSGGTLSTSGSITRSPATTTTYSLNCYFNDGSNQSSSRTVTVSPPQNLTTFTTSQSTVTAGSQITLTWSTVNGSYCTTTSWPSAGNLATSGSINRTVNTTTTYSITCYYNDGSNETVSRTVTVSSVPVVQNTVTISASPSTMVSGSSSTLSWQASQSSAVCTFSNQSGAVIPSTATFTGIGSLIVRPSTNAQYRIVCVFPNGTPLSVSALASIAVTTTPIIPAITTSGYSSGGSSGISSGNIIKKIPVTTTVTEVKPTTITHPAKKITKKSASISGTYTTQGCPASVYFAYGKNKKKLSTSPSVVQDYVSGQISTSLINLKPRTTYYYKFMATNCLMQNNAAVSGKIVKFTTK